MLKNSTKETGSVPSFKRNLKKNQQMYSKKADPKGPPLTVRGCAQRIGVQSPAMQMQNTIKLGA